jgi:hypothetical protein
MFHMLPFHDLSKGFFKMAKFGGVEITCDNITFGDTFPDVIIIVFCVKNILACWWRE